MRTHKDLEVWKRGIDLVTKVYQITLDFPKEEVYGLTSQMRRAGVSVPANIAEGASRHSDKEFIQFLYIALGSLTELDTHFIISHNLEYLNKETYHDLSKEAEEIGRMLSGLIKYVKRKSKN